MIDWYGIAILLTIGAVLIALVVGRVRQWRNRHNRPEWETDELVRRFREAFNNEEKL